jgi:hypothetical protein
MLLYEKHGESKIKQGRRMGLEELDLEIPPKSEYKLDGSPMLRKFFFISLSPLSPFFCFFFSDAFFPISSSTLPTYFYFFLISFFPSWIYLVKDPTVLCLSISRLLLAKVEQGL